MMHHQKNHGFSKLRKQLEIVLTKQRKMDLVIKDTENKKTVKLNPSMKIQTEGTILLDYKFLGDGTKETEGNN
jgi:hypothetical protein